MKQKAWIQTLAVLAVASSITSTAYADTTNPDRAQDLTLTVSGTMKEKLDEKHALAKLHENVRVGKSTQAEEDQAFEKFVAKWGGIGLTASEKNKALKRENGITFNPQALYGSHYVPVSQLSQPNNYYCGPASATEIIRQIGVNPSLAMSDAANYLGTNTDGTVWSKRAITGSYYYPMADTLDYYSNSANNYAAEASPSAATFKSDVTYTIDKGYPVSADVVENANGTHLVGHPTNLTIYHWIAIDGYSASGDNTQYADSASGGQGFSTAWNTASIPTKSTLNSSTIAGMTSGRGIIW
ncbi:C39 family peptidase [Tumebacillus permanentifrigoris]|uniref:Peptidase C39-like protein n=1 Tax=Tumebacillus permanentifrigoris TaxID=378543 RepID=A0A316DGU2_9BACL|nr:C39 family peptidase [Tumebacillus permanentifrigoris]PWK16459.1 peptidase C39-like protein [Tumebacillus permanentifrigoris]